MEVFPQSFNIQKYTVEKGLPDNGVYDITQDSEGKMWFATLSGISCYDGSAWTNYNEKNGLAAARYFRVVRDDENTIWAIPSSPFDSIVYFKNSTWNFISFPDEKKLSVTSFEPVRLNGELVLFLGSNHGLFVYKNTKWHKFTSKDGLPNSFINNITSHENKVYVSTRNGYSVFDGNKFDNSLNEKLGTKLKNTFALLVKKENNTETILTFTEDGIGSYKDNNHKTILAKLKLRWLTFFERPVFLTDRRGRIYFGNSSAKFFIDEKSGSLVELGRENGFISAGAHSMFIDREDNVWISYGRGLDKISSMRFRNYNALAGLLEDEVVAIDQLKDGTFVFGHNTGVTFFSNQHFEKIDLRENKNTFMHFRVNDIAKDSEGNLWAVSAQYGICKIDSKRNIRWYLPEFNTNFNSLTFDDNGLLWIVATNGIYILRNGKFENVSYIIPDATSHRKIKNIDGLLYLSGPGLKIIDPSTFKLLKTFNYPRNYDLSNLYSTFKDDKGRILLSHYKGVYELINDSIVPFKPLQDKINSPVYFIQQDNKNNYWIGTNKGVYKWDLNNLRQFTIKNGLAGNETNRSAGYIDYTGKVWIGTDNGVSCYEEEYDTYPEFIPVPKLLYFEGEGNEKFLLTENITLPSSENTLYFYFRGISFIDESSINFKIKLEPFDEDWIEVYDNGPSPMRYTNLSPGTYRLHIKTRNGSGEWSEVLTSADITISQPFYRHFWFLLLLFGAAGYISYVLYRYAAQRQYFSKLENEIVNRTAELKASEQKYRVLVETMNEGLAVVDAEGNYSFVNYRFCEMLGCEPDELFGERSELKDCFKIYADGELPQNQTVERTIKRKNGDEIFVIISPRPLLNAAGNYIGCFGVFTDITQRKKVEQSLQESNDRYKELAESFTDMFFALDTNLCFTYWNNATEKVSGIKSSEALGRSAEVLFPKISSEKILPSLKSVLKDQNPVNVVADVSSNNKKEYFEFNIYPSKQGLAVFVKDISERIAAEEAVKKYSEELKDLNAAKDKFFSIISHDLKSPFQGLLGFSSALKDEYENLTREEIKTFTGHIQNTTKNLYSLLQNLLQWSRIQTGKIEFRPAVCNLKDEVDYAFSLLQGTADNKKMVLLNSINEKVSVFADINMLNSILLNLVTNAIKFTLPGGTVSVSAQSNGSKVSVIVADSGIGIKKENIEFLFRIDKQFTTPGTDQESGSGLGLIICKDLVHKHQGEISVESESGKGTKFIFTLPADKHFFI